MKEYKSELITKIVCAYSEKDTGWFIPGSQGYHCKMISDLENWCFTDRQRKSVLLEKLFRFAVNTVVSQNKGIEFYPQPHIDYAFKMFLFYKEYAETIV